MASAFAHGLLAVALGKMWGWRDPPVRFWVLSIICSLVPDIDVVGWSLGIPYDDMWGHRGLTHSLGFAFLLSVLVVRVGFPSVKVLSRHGWILLTHFFLVTVFHGVLDALTDGGLGVAFFAPFDNTRYFFPWTPIKVSPLGIQEFFSSWGLQVLASEFIWIWLPVLSISAFVAVYRRSLMISKRTKRIRTILSF